MSFREYVEQQLRDDPEFRAEYERLEPVYAFVRALVRARLDAGLTQTELAERIGTKQTTIARLEAGARQPSLSFIQKLAAALNVSFEVLPTGSVVVHADPTEETAVGNS